MSKFLAFDNQYFTNLTSALLGYLARQTPLEELRQNPKILTINARLILDILLGSGQIEQHNFPGEIQLLHFTFQLNTPLALHSHNPPHTDWVLLNINLSAAAIEKTVNKEIVEIQRYLPSGILFYPPDTTVSSASEPGTPYEIALVRIKKWTDLNFCGAGEPNAL